MLKTKPKDDAIVLCVDKKSRIQMLDHTQPLLPLGLGQVEGVTHDSPPASPGLTAWLADAIAL